MAEDLNIGGMNVSIGVDTNKFDREMKGMVNRSKKAAKKLEDDFNSLNPNNKKFIKQSEEIKNALKKAKQEVRNVQKSLNTLNKLGKIPSVIKQQKEYKQKLEQAKNKVVELIQKHNELKRKMRETSSVATRGGNNIRKAYDGIIKTVLKVAAAIYLLRKAWNFAREAKNAARDAEETENKFNEVFISLRKEADLTARSYAKSFGLAVSTAKELLSATGDILVGFGFAEKAAFDMSVKVNSLAQDLASFQNFAGGAKGASEALTKALVGETESAKALGIVIRQNTPEFIKNVKEIMRAEGATLLQAKSIEILRIAYDQSGKAVGDFNRTQHQLANQERILSEKYKEVKEIIGNQLTGSFLSATKAALSLLRALTETEMDEAIRKLGELGLKGEKLGEFLKFKLELEDLNKLDTAIAKLKELEASILSNAQMEFIGSGGQAYLDFWDEADKFLKKSFEERRKQVTALQNSLLAALKNQTKLLRGGEDTTEIKKTIKLLEVQIELFGDIAKTQGQIFDLQTKITGVISGGAREADMFNELIRKGLAGKFVEELKNTEKTIGEIEDDIKTLKESLKGMVFESELYFSTIKEINILEKSITSEKKKHTSEIKKQTKEIETQKGKMIELLETIDTAFDPSKRGKIIDLRGLADKGDMSGETEDKLTGALEKGLDSAKEGFGELGIIATSFVDVFQGEFSQAWRGVFGEANSLFEKLMQRIASSFLETIASSIASSIFGELIGLIPGGGILSSLFGKKSGSGSKGGIAVPSGPSLLSGISASSIAIPGLQLPGALNTTLNNAIGIPNNSGQSNYSRQEIRTLNKSMNRVNGSVQAMNVNLINNLKTTPKFIIVTSDPTARVKGDMAIRNRILRGGVNESELL